MDLSVLGASAGNCNITGLFNDLHIYLLLLHQVVQGDPPAPWKERLDGWKETIVLEWLTDGSMTE